MLFISKGGIGFEEKTNHYLSLIKRYEPELNINKYETDFFNGWHNDIIIINDLHVFRFAKLDLSVNLLEREIKVLQVLHDFVTLPVPHFILVDKGVVKYDFIAGNPLYRHDLLLADDKTQEAVAKKLGVFLKQMHSIPLDILEGINLNPSGARAEASVSCDNSIKVYNDIKQKLFPHMRSYTQKIIERYYIPLFNDKHFMDYEPVLIHADLAPYHILCNDGLDITGVIDFGVSRLGDPAADVALLLIGLGESLVNRMFNYYPEIQKFINRARFIASTLPLIWELRALESGKAKWNVFHLMEAKDIYPISL